MINIPVAFLPGFWVTLPVGLEEKGSGFLLAEGIKSVFTIDIVIPASKNHERNWSVVSLTESEARSPTYLSAFVRLLSETWLDVENIILVGTEQMIVHVLTQFLHQIGNIEKEVAEKMIRTKMG